MTRSRTLAFRLASAASVVAAFYHAAAIAVPEFGRLAYPPGYPVWRHIVFVLIDGNLGWLLLRRPIWLIWPYAVLTVQAVSSHGGAASRMWRQNGGIDWISIVVIIGLPLVLGLLYVEPTQSIGAIAVAPSDPNVIYVGSGEGLQRPDLSVGDGIYKSTDAGRTWQHVLFKDDNTGATSGLFKSL